MAVGESDLSVFIRNGAHTGAASDVVKLALKCEQFTIQYSQSPIQISQPGDDQILFDLGFSKPSMTLSGLVDNIGGNTGNTSHNADQNQNVKGMTSMTLNGQVYYIPYKNWLEAFLIRHAADTTELEIEVGDATTPDATSGAFSTGGGIYKGALQQMQFNQTPGLEDRWLFTLGFLLKRREGI